MKKLILFILPLLLFLSLSSLGWGADFYYTQMGVLSPLIKKQTAQIHIGPTLGYDGKIIASTTDGKVWLYNVTEANSWKLSTNDGGSTTTASKMLFLDSRGYLFASWPGGVWRSTDNGDNWTQVITFTQSDDSTAEPTAVFDNMAEDSSGNLFGGMYQATVRDEPYFYWSTDGGANWSRDKTTFLQDQQPANYKHIHWVYWWAEKSVLCVSLGDTGNYSEVFFSATPTVGSWTRWITKQTYALTSDSSYLYGSYDNGTQRGIWRVATPGAAPTEVYTRTVVVGSTGVLGTHGFIDSNGYVVFAYSRDGTSTGATGVIYSTDNGGTWTFGPDSTNGWANGATKLAGVTVFEGVSRYYTSGSWDGYNHSAYLSGAVATALTNTRWRIYPSNSNFYINPTSGVDYTNSGLSTAPWKTIIATNLETFSSGQIINLGGSTTDHPLILRSSNLTIDGKGYGVTGAVTTAAVLPINGFEGAAPLTEGESHGLVDQASILFAHGGTHSMEIKPDDDADVVHNITGGKTSAFNAGSGATIWAEGYIYFDNGVASAKGTMELLTLNGTGLYIAVRLGPAIDTNVANAPYLRFYGIGTSTSYYQGNITPAVFVVDTWYKVKVRVYIHATQGTLTFWIDNVPKIHLVGVVTLGTANFTAVYWGMIGAPKEYTSTDIIIYWDDVGCGVVDPDLPNAIEVSGGTNILRRLNQTEPINVTGTNNQIDYTISNGSSSGVIVASGATGTNLYNLTINGSTGAGLTANEDVTIKNTISYGNTGADITIGAGKTVTGDYNIFEDAAKAGAGTYTDGGHTQWSTNPLFRSATDFHLTSGSPAINAGVDVGLTSDYEGKTVPHGINELPDIGAYEFYPYGVIPGITTIPTGPGYSVIGE